MLDFGKLLTHGDGAFYVCRLLKDVGAACTEANDTVKYLKPLRKYLEKLNNMYDYVALIELFKPMFHTVLLIWKHSGFYNTSAKMVTLIREMCNDLIMQACKFAPGQIHLPDTVYQVQPTHDQPPASWTRKSHIL